MDQRKKILILIDWFYPGYKAGGPIQSVLNLIHLLRSTYDVYVLTTDTDHGESEPYKNIVSDKWSFSDELGVYIYYAKKSKLNKQQIKTEINNIDANFIYLNHMYSPLFVLYPLLLKYTGKLKAKLVICPRGALYNSAIAVKAFKKRPLLFVLRLLKIQKKILFHATNEREKVAIEKYFPAADILVADNLPDFNQKEFKVLSKYKGDLKCVFISRIVPIKNLSFILDVLQQVKAKILLTIAGPTEDIAYWDLCKKKILKLPSNIQVNFVGSVSKSEIQNLIESHHLFVLPTKGENFGHAIFESFLYGRPVLISDQTPWLDLLDSKSGWDLPLNNPEKFVTTLEEFANFGQQEFDIFARGAWNYAHEFIMKNSSKENYLKLFS